MATYANDLRLKEIGIGDEDGTWGLSTNTNLALIADAFSFGTKQLASDADVTLTIPDAVADDTRSLFLRITSAVSLTATRTITLAPSSVSKVWIIENATTGGQAIEISQGSGSKVLIANNARTMVATDGGGAGAAVVVVSPTVNLASQVNGVLPVASGGTGGTTSTGTGAVVLATSPTLATPTLTAPESTGAIYDNGSVRGNITAVSALDIDCSLGNYFTKTINANSTFTFSSVPASRSYSFVLELTHTSGTITWPASVRWPGNVTPAPLTGNTHLFVFVTDDGGTRWRGAALLNYPN
jgi:hypothetical protein